MTDYQLSEFPVVADAHAYNDDHGQGRDAISFITTDVPTLWARLRPVLATDGIHAIVMDTEDDHLLIGRERPSLVVRLLLALFTLRRPSTIYLGTEDLPVLDTDEKYHSLTRWLPRVDEDDPAAIAADDAERARLEEFAATSIEVIVYDKVWGRTNRLRRTLREHGLI